MDRQEAREEARGQSRNLLGRRFRQKLRREIFTYCGSLVGWAFTGWAVNANSIKLAFYSAVATIIPVLLLALLLRYGQARVQIADIGAEVDLTLNRKRELRARAGSALDEHRSELNAFEAELEAIEQRVAEKTLPEDVDKRLTALHDQFNKEREDLSYLDEELGPDPYFSGVRLHRLSEENFAGLMLSLAVGGIGLWASLGTVAAGDSQIVSFAFTASSLTWVLIEMARLEINGFVTQSWTNEPDDGSDGVTLTSEIRE